jgi:hypothetical protein
MHALRHSPSASLFFFSALGPLASHLIVGIASTTRRSTLEKAPLLDVKSLQHPLRDLVAILHQSRLLACLSFLVLARIMRGIDRNHNIRTLLFQAKQQQVDSNKVGSLAWPFRRWWRLDERKGVYRVVSGFRVSCLTTSQMLPRCECSRHVTCTSRPKRAHPPPCTRTSNLRYLCERGVRLL